MKSNKPVIDAPTERVAANLRRIRKMRGLSAYAMSGELGEIDHPIAPAGITRIERGERLVNADDLVALGLVLRCSPNALFMPDVLPETLAGDVVAVGKVHVSAVDLWGWAVGETALVVDDGRAQPDPSPIEQALFVATNQPHHYATSGTHSVVAGATDGVLTVLRQVIREAVQAGVNPDRLAGFCARTIADAEREFDDTVA